MLESLKIPGEEELLAAKPGQTVALTGVNGTLAAVLAEKEIVIATETGGGVVPVDADERRMREEAGRLSCMLAERADTVIRVCCGLPQLLKGVWPCESH